MHPMSPWDSGPIDQSRRIESWTWFGVCLFVVIWRFISRVLVRKSIHRLQFDDWLMIPTFLLYLNLIIWVNIQGQHPLTNILPPGVKASELSPDEITKRTTGSTATFIVEQNMCLVQWLCKFCVLLMFHRLTIRTSIQVYVKAIMVYSLLGFLVFEIFFFGLWCRPFTNYFAVIDDNTEGCTTSQNHLIMSFVFNLSSDLLILIIPFKMFMKSSLPLKKKLTLWVVFSLGILVCISAIMTRVYCFLFPSSVQWIYWYVREASAAVLVANIPNCWTLLQRICGWTDWSGRVATTARRAAGGLARSRGSQAPAGGSGSGIASNAVDMGEATGDADVNGDVEKCLESARPDTGKASASGSGATDNAIELKDLGTSPAVATTRIRPVSSKETEINIEPLSPSTPRCGSAVTSPSNPLVPVSPGLGFTPPVVAVGDVFANYHAAMRSLNRNSSAPNPPVFNGGSSVHAPAASARTSINRNSLHRTSTHRRSLLSRHAGLLARADSTRSATSAADSDPEGLPRAARLARRGGPLEIHEQTVVTVSQEERAADASKGDLNDGRAPEFDSYLAYLGGQDMSGQTSVHIEALHPHAPEDGEDALGSRRASAVSATT